MKEAKTLIVAEIKKTEMKKTLWKAIAVLFSSWPFPAHFARSTRLYTCMFRPGISSAYSGKMDPR